MSNFYKSMDCDKRTNMQFKTIKRMFKQGQPCKMCGNKLPKQQMSVDHIIPVSDPCVDPFDMTNWQVLCLPCHRKKTFEENLALQGASVVIER